MQKIKISEGKIGKEYVTVFGKIIQLVEKHQQFAKILVFATDAQISVKADYEVYDMGDDLIKKLEDKTIRTSGVIPIGPEMLEDVTTKIEETQKPKKKEPMVAKANIKKAAVKNKSNEEDEDMESEEGVMDSKKLSLKKFVWEMLKKGIQTREGLTKAVIEANISQCTEPKKVKKYVSMALASLKKREGLNIVSIEPGKYQIIDK